MYVHCPVYTVHCTSYTSWLKVNSRNNGTAVKVTREIFCNLFLQEHLLLVAVFWGVWLCSCCHADPPGCSWSCPISLTFLAPIILLLLTRSLEHLLDLLDIIVISELNFFLSINTYFCKKNMQTYLGVIFRNICIKITRKIN